MTVNETNMFFGTRAPFTGCSILFFFLFFFTFKPQQTVRSMKQNKTVSQSSVFHHVVTGNYIYSHLQ